METVTQKVWLRNSKYPVEVSIDATDLAALVAVANATEGPWWMFSKGLLPFSDEFVAAFTAAFPTQVDAAEQALRREHAKNMPSVVAVYRRRAGQEGYDNLMKSLAVSSVARQLTKLHPFR